MLIKIFATPELTRARLWFAFAVAGVTDAVQIAFGPAGFFFIDQILDVIAMVLISAAIGFHPLLLPTFALELLPVADLLPSWTGCTAAVVMLRKRTARQPSSAPPPIDVSADVTRVPPQHPN